MLTPHAKAISPQSFASAMSPATAFLQQAIDQATKALTQDNPPAAAGGTDGLVFIGNWQGTYPTTLILDPSLNAVDVRVFLFICHYSREFNQGATPFPSYELICKRLRISKPTLANALTRLRLTRWLSVVKHRVRDAKGRFKGQIMALSDSPLALIDALEIDPSYLELVEQTATEHNDRKTKLVAQGVLVGLEEQKAQGIDPLARPSPIIERQSSILGLDEPDSLFFGVADLSGRQRLLKQQQQKQQQQIQQRMQEEQKTLLGASAITKLSTENGIFSPGKESLPGDLPSQNSLPGVLPGKDSLLGSQVIDFKDNKNSLLGEPYSTSTSNSNSTVRVDSFLKPNPLADSWVGALNWYPDLVDISAQHKDVLTRILQAQTPDNAQIILDALAYRYQSVIERGSEPLRSPVTYARSLLKRLASGNLVPVKPELDVVIDNTVNPAASFVKPGSNSVASSNNSAKRDSAKREVVHPSHRPFKSEEPDPKQVLSPEISKAKIQKILRDLMR